MNLVSIKDLRINLTDYTNRVFTNGESFVVLKKSKPVFKIVPYDQEDEWETVIDFTQINTEGVSAEDVLKTLKELEEEEEKKTK